MNWSFEYLKAALCIAMNAVIFSDTDSFPSGY